MKSPSFTFLMNAGIVIFRTTLNTRHILALEATGSLSDSVFPGIAKGNLVEVLDSLFGSCSGILSRLFVFFSCLAWNSSLHW